MIIHAQDIRKDIESQRDATKLTKEDEQYAEQQRQGMDKFKTMKKIQSGLYSM